MLLLDQGLPRTTAVFLRRSGIESIHVGEMGLAEADDATILDRARHEDAIVVTLDADFHARLALTGAEGPSVIRIRIEGLRAEQLAELLVKVLDQSKDDLDHGALVTVTETGVRVRCLPLVR